VRPREHVVRLCAWMAPWLLVGWAYWMDPKAAFKNDLVLAFLLLPVFPVVVQVVLLIYDLKKYRRRNDRKP
jgi:hypothetical protein